ncbi:hypothetical protein ACJ41O_011551 [Fusarium nematophilum]
MQNARMDVDCSSLEELNDFSTYVQALHTETQFDVNRIRLCKAEVCNAVYGTGNPDISGIGVAVGYVLELALGIFLTLAVIVLRNRRRGPGSEEWYRILMCGLRAFFDSAAYFALALQLATIVVLVQKDYGISTADLGAIEARIAQTVAVVSMMPLLYPVALLEPSARSIKSDEAQHTARSRSCDARHNARLLLLSATASLSFYPFLSRCIHAFGESPIGSGGGAEVSSVDWGVVERMCFPDRFKSLRKSSTWKALEGLELAASLMTYLFTFWLLAGLPNTQDVLDEPPKSELTSERALSWRERVNNWLGERPLVAVMPLLAIIGLAVPLLWVVFTLRKLQEELSGNTGEAYEGKDWGFGQIVSIILFVPVGVEMAYRWRFGPAYELGG